MSTVPEQAGLLGGVDLALLQQLGVDSSRLRAAAAWLEQMRAKQEMSEAQAQARSGPAPDSLASLKDELRILRRENALLCEQADMLADALGACHCFGVDPDCLDCGGDGAPGTYLPGRRNFRSFVVPVLESLRELHRAGGALPSTPQASPKSTNTPAQDGD